MFRPDQARGAFLGMSARKMALSSLRKAFPVILLSAGLLGGCYYPPGYYPAYGYGYGYPGYYGYGYYPGYIGTGVVVGGWGWRGGWGGGWGWRGGWGGGWHGGWGGGWHGGGGWHH